ncbi:MAG: phage tail sheath subtilisin-like domain-containing protein, partial [Dolichospermum sp.]
MPTYLSPGVYVEEVSSGSAPIAGAGTSVAGFIAIITPNGATPQAETKVSSGEIKLITNFTEFKQNFGDFTKDNQGQNIFAHGVYGFFRNGGTRAYVTWVSDANGVDGVLNDFEAIDEISIVVAPGQTDANIIGKIKDHAVKMGDRIAILDSKSDKNLGLGLSEKNAKGEDESLLPGVTSYAAFYFPWIEVYDPATKTNIFVPPSGHIAGVYARVDGERGVHKAPANVPLLGALDLQLNISKAKQDGLNPQGVNVIRKLNG